ncbi:hypothetical protein [Xanthomonas sacchari]|uniref:hypothetical protein n=1 Tax=Xanthomonas sacchari TaxID=56458 RepID=UPI002250441F|nr:hypothetical protein [Xanthomonas sacchari]MCW0447237.1 hypothetical protein [Xanthomonas sacchari]
MSLIEKARIVVRNWLLAPAAGEIQALQEPKARANVEAIVRRVLVPYTSDYIECTCAAKQKQDCICIKSHQTQACDLSAPGDTRCGCVRSLVLHSDQSASPEDGPFVLGPQGVTFVPTRRVAARR